MCHQIDSKVDKESHSTSELSAKWQLFDSQYHSLYFLCNWQISLKIIYVIAFTILGKDPESPSHGNRRLRHKVACNMQTFFLWGVFTASDGFPWLVFCTISVWKKFPLSLFRGFLCLTEEPVCPKRLAVKQWLAKIKVCTNEGPFLKYVLACPTLLLKNVYYIPSIKAKSWSPSPNQTPQTPKLV